MNTEALVTHLRERPDELRLVIYHACQGEDRPVVARRFSMAWQPHDYACPLCGVQPGRDGFLYEWALDQAVPADVPRWLEEDAAP